MRVRERDEGSREGGRKMMTDHWGNILLLGFRSRVTVKGFRVTVRVVVGVRVRAVVVAVRVRSRVKC